MNITEDVILDLLPLYDSGEASSGTKALVEEYLAQNPQFAKVAEAARHSTILHDLPSTTGDGHERAVIARTRQLVRRRGRILAMAVVATLLPLAFAFDREGVSFWMWRDEPGSRGLWLVGAWLWFELFRLHRRLREV